MDYEKERLEAMIAGDEALYWLYLAKEELESAARRGVMDFFVGGILGDIVTYSKHRKLDAAQQNIDQARIHLQEFSKEMQDIRQVMDIQLELDDLLRLADYFFDGLFADWFVQDKINKAKKQVDDAIQYVEEIMSILRGE